MTMIASIIERYFLYGERSDDILQTEMPEIDAKLGYIDYNLKERITSEDDLKPLSKAPADSTILDIGANYGYSVTSLVSFGCKSRIISFEVIEQYAPFLEKLKAILNQEGYRFDFRVTGLSDEHTPLKFVQPVLNGKALSALTTCRVDTHLPSYIQNCTLCAERDGLQSFKLYEFFSPVTTVDSALTSTFDVPTSDIFAMKLDVEGHELSVLRGATETINRFHPIILSEGANYNSSLIALLKDNGYEFAERKDAVLSLRQSPGTEINAFFVHPSHLERYLALGILAV